ncbi:thioredoxin fold domain-containing protein [Marinomonas sp. A79]|uniref:Thiol:disulfide interchange protein n=1 Tax=Marinomonas vulgaris TaxID=2823372 RepID=A0ABS5HDT1_9GAMM|nr:thioredoxin fold domain-containing protein [Marinomonas vulgaris]MBR7889104.1 thioredoxin fold domain-containing protein [Marinomonas vulgaris]
MKYFLRSFARSRVMSFLLLPISGVVMADQAAVLSAVNTALPQYEVESAEQHAGSGLFVVSLKGGPTIHVTPDGQYFIAGDMYRMQGTSLENETEKAKLAKVEALPESDMIVYKAENEKAHITVFTDIDCGYCRKLHKEVPELNDAGITVRYLAYPRAGVGSESYQKMVSVWCSADPQTALTQSKNGEAVPENTCTNPIADQYVLGNEVGVRGTPTIVLGDGRLLPGYLPAAELIKRLGM